MTLRRPAVFLDRDGTLNEMVYDESHGVMDSPLVPDRLVLCRQAGPFVRALNRLGFLCIVVTNQPGIAKGKLTVRRLDQVHSKLRADLARSGARLDGVHFCPHHPEMTPGGRAEFVRACACRKPAPGLLLEAAARHHVDLARSFVVGDGLTDVEAGRRAGVAAVLVAKCEAALLERIDAQPSARPDYFARDLTQALAFIVRAREASLP